MELRLCECYMGQLKGPCKHKSIVSTTQNIPSFDVVPTESAAMRAIFMFLATGKKPDTNWFKPLSSANVSNVNMSGILDRIETLVRPEVIDPLPVPEMDVEEEVGEDEDRGSSVDELKAKLKAALNKLEEKIGQRIDKDTQGYNKALDIFTKHVERLPVNNDSTLQSSLCNFGAIYTEAISVTKRKKGKYINVQATSRSRRAIPIRGSRSAFFGAPRKDQRVKTQLFLSGQDDDVFAHKLPGKSKKKKKKHPHNLMKSVMEGRSAERKH